VARMRENRNACVVLIGKSEGNVQDLGVQGRLISKCEHGNEVFRVCKLGGGGIS
jgi:hypothetical protein